MGAPSKATSWALHDLINLVQHGTITVHDAISVFVHHVSAEKLAPQVLLSLQGLCTLGFNSNISDQPGDLRMPLTLCAAGDRALIALSAGAIW
jgi:hypothetical protein